MPIEEKLLEDKNGLVLVKNIRKVLHEVLTKNLCNLVTEITQHQVVSSHSDVSAKTGEILDVFVLDVNYEKELNKGLKNKSLR